MRNPGNATCLLLVAAGSLVLASAALAQQTGESAGSAAGTASTALTLTPKERAAASRTGGIPLGPLRAYPSLDLRLQYNDNIYSTADNKTSSMIWTLTPAIRLDALRAGGNNYGIFVNLGSGTYTNNSADNFTDFNAGAFADFDLSTRLRAGIRADTTFGHDARGSTNDAFTATPNEFRQLNTAAKVSYGAPGARGRLEFDLGNTQRHYTNNRDSAALNDRNTDNYGATFFWRVAPKTEILINGIHSKIDYSLAPGWVATNGTPYVSADSTENSLLIGVKWEATAKTTGIFKIGRSTKEFADSSRAGGSNSSWEGTIRWSPLTYSVVDLTLRRGAIETSGGVGDYILDTSTAAKWNHQWSSRVSTDVIASYATNAYKGLSTPRDDEIQVYGANLNYSMRRWLKAGAGYTHNVRDSDQNVFDYKSNVFMLYLTGTL